MSREKLLNIEPQQLTFRFEPREQASCTIRLSNNSRRHVAFKFMTTSPEKYCVRPRVGVVLPQSSCDVTVTVRGSEKIPSNMQCRDKFLIKSVVASPGDTTETSSNLFNGGHVVEDCKLRVVYISPTHQHSSHSDRSGGGSPSASTLLERTLDDTEAIQGQDRNGMHVGDLFKKGIIIALSCLILSFFVVKMLPLVWSLNIMITMLIIKMMQKLVSDSVEDWIVKALLQLCLHLSSTVFSAFRRAERRPDNES